MNPLWFSPVLQQKNSAKTLVGTATQITTYKLQLIFNSKSNQMRDGGRGRKKVWEALNNIYLKILHLSILDLLFLHLKIMYQPTFNICNNVSLRWVKIKQGHISAVMTPTPKLPTGF